MRFPILKSRNLNKRRMMLPTDLEGSLNLVLLAFHRHHQMAIDSWMPFLQRLSDRYPAFAYYELPVLATGWRLSRGMIDSGMRAGVSDQQARERTITLYLDKDAFRQALDIPDEDTIRLLLLDASGEVLWRTEGPFTEAKGQALEAFVARWYGEHPQDEAAQ